MSSIEIKPMTNRICLSLFDVYTTSYYLTESMTMEKNEEVGENLDEL